MGGGGGQGGDMSGMGTANMMPGSGAMNYNPQGGFGGVGAYNPSPNVGTNAMPGGAPIPKSFNPGDKFMPGAVNPARSLNQAGTGGMGPGGAPMLTNPRHEEHQIYNAIAAGKQPGQLGLGLHLGKQLGANSVNIQRAIYDRMSHGMKAGQLGLHLGGGAQAAQQGVPIPGAPNPMEAAQTPVPGMVKGGINPGGQNFGALGPNVKGGGLAPGYNPGAPQSSFGGPTGKG